MKDVLRANLSIAEQLTAAADKIFNSQLEEAVRQISKSHRTLTAAEAAEQFSACFDNGLISGFFFDFCKCLAENGLCRKSGLKSGRLPGTVALTDNVNTRSAAEKLFGEAEFKSHICSDLRSCCEAASDNPDEGCILPVASTEDGVYSSFFKFIRAYELKICGICDIVMQDRESEMRFALLSKSSRSASSGRHIAFSFLPDKNEFSLLVSVFNRAGIQIEFVNCSPCEFAVDKTEYGICADCAGADPFCVKYFLEAALPGHMDMGIF